MGEVESSSWSVEIGVNGWCVRNAAGRTWSEPDQRDRLSLVRRLLGSVLDQDVAEHHVLAAHGEGIFSGLCGNTEDWAERLLLLLGELDRLRTIIAEWPDGHMMMSRTELKTRAWNDAIIRELLRPAATMANPHYENGGSMVLFDTRKVLAAERTQRWLEATARLRAQRIVRAAQPTATRAVRKRAAGTAAMDPAELADELARIATADDAEAVRAVATDGLERHFRGRQWKPADLADPAVARFAALLGDAEVLSVAVQHPDADVRVAASRRVLESLAS